MSIPVYKRKESDILYVISAYELEKEITIYMKKLSKNNTYYSLSIMKYATLQSDFANMSIIFNNNIEEDIYKLFLIRLSKFFLRKLKIEIRIFYNNIILNPSKSLIRNNGKYFTSGEVQDMLSRWYRRVFELIDKQEKLLNKILSKSNSYDFIKFLNIMKHEYFKFFKL